MGSIISMFAVTTGGTQDAIASIDVPMNGNLVGVDWSGQGDFDTTLDDMKFQLSFGSTYSQANDARQVISVANLGGLVLVTAAGAVLAVADKFVILPDLPVGMGERIYIHSLGAAGVVSNIFCLLHFSFNIDQASVRRR